MRTKEALKDRNVNGKTQKPRFNEIKNKMKKKNKIKRNLSMIVI